MSTARVRTAALASGEKRYRVYYRRGGRNYPEEYAGSFRTKREAQTRRDLVAGELAAGRDPRRLLRELQRPSRPSRAVSAWGNAWLDSRHDLDESSKTSYRRKLKAVCETFGDRDPVEITAAEVREWIGALSTSLRPSSVKAYVTTLRVVLDFAAVEPNPARDASVKLPRDVRDEPSPPSSDEVLAILERVPARHFVVLEQTGMRVGELASLVWGDVDAAGSRFRLARSRTETNRSRWVQLPAWLMHRVADLCPAEDRTPGRRVFDTSEAALRQAMARACRTAEIALYSPHDLRHRRTSLWHGQGVPAKELSERVGHALASITLDTYSHVMPLDEIAAERLAEVVA